MIRRQLIDVELLLLFVPALAKEISDPVAGDGEEPSCDMLDRHQQPVRFDETREDVLQYVVDVGGIGNPTTDEVAKTRPFARHNLRNLQVLFDYHPPQ